MDSHGNMDIDPNAFVMPEGGIENLKVFWAGSNLREKLQFLFELFDLDGDLQVEKAEMLNVFVAIYQYCNVDTEEYAAQIQNSVDRIYQIKDSDGDGKLSEEEFLEVNKEADELLILEIEKTIGIKEI